MKLPAADVTLAGGLTFPAAVISRAQWIAHVVKHPLGLNALARSRTKGAWNAEGWDQLSPPVISTTARDAVLRDITSLEIDGARCGVPEFHRARDGSDLGRLACVTCAAPLAERCEQILEETSQAYAAVIQSLVEGFVADAAIAVRREEFARRLMQALARRRPWTSLSVLTVGLDDRSQSSLIARISRGDGVRAEFYVRGTALAWRTAWRRPPAHAAAATSFLLDHARPHPRAPLSDLCLVDRRWWEHSQEASP